MPHTSEAGPNPTRFSRSRRVSSITRNSAGWTPTGYRTSIVASCPTPVAEGRSVGSRPPRLTTSEPTGNPPGRSSPSTSKSRPTCRWPTRSDSADASKPSTTCSCRSGRYPGRQHPDGPAIPRAIAGGRARDQAARGLLFRVQEAIRRLSHPEIWAESTGSLGFYDPPKSARSGRAPAYFYYYAKGQLPVEANLYHEVSHQLLFETAGRNAYTSNFGNYWVFEGLGTYFETVEPQPDGSLEVGGLVGPRVEVAIQSLVDREKRYR